MNNNAITNWIVVILLVLLAGFFVVVDVYGRLSVLEKTPTSAPVTADDCVRSGSDARMRLCLNIIKQRQDQELKTESN